MSAGRTISFIFPFWFTANYITQNLFLLFLFFPFVTHVSPCNLSQFLLFSKWHFHLHFHCKITKPNQPISNIVKTFCTGADDSAWKSPKNNWAADLSLLLWHHCPHSQGKWRGIDLSHLCSTVLIRANLPLMSEASIPPHTGSRVRCEPYLQVVTHLLAVRQALDLCGRAQVQSLPLISETEGPCYPHVCDRQIVDVQQRAEAGQAEEKQIPRLVTSCHTWCTCSVPAF